MLVRLLVAASPAGTGETHPTRGGIAMKVIVPVAMSLVATFIAVVAARLIARHDFRTDLEEFPGAA